ncbi:MAG TPA: thiamine diphosphokinase [Spirochaetales bacterium]|nr:thiamine diphosphokinase [Spirochaetales bacterium]HPG85544.1 thiamine diphosphokinase [Spirochaetales bacterium]HPM73741.1 thiamine diphosphokinase [Spirochaetales bacterium]
MIADRPALLVTGGDAPPFSALSGRLGEFLYICAADSGLDTLRSWGLRADLAVGDMDSLADRSLLDGCAEVLAFDRDKDDTDTELGLRELRARGYGPITMAGGGGGRLDHLLALRALLERPSGPDEWLCAGERVVRLEEKRSFVLAVGATVSVFPLSGGASGMRSVGLKWPLDGLSWGSGGFGVSNVAVSSMVTIDPGQRPIFVVLPL